MAKDNTKLTFERVDGKWYYVEWDEKVENHNLAAELDKTCYLMDVDKRDGNAI